MTDSIGTCYWITGYSGSGKTTVSKLLWGRLLDQGKSVLLLDGDTLRYILGEKIGHSRDERLQLGLTYGRLCQVITSQGLDVICATISMFTQVHNWNRQNILNYREIYLCVPISILEQRDEKGIYKDARISNNNNVVGLGLKGEEPLSPDLIIKNYGTTTAQSALEEIMKSLVI